ncbi:uncharacterized protein PV09_06033 [Verruconis gallopava]|uniref:Oxidoreductase NAD-binding domain-containing protein 1 n=1 Tax=Verruconis gallopava TaxID=253628 RepID=A0A0D2A776_9PEZI|nr:uncharacterized protein PV09_06033 [Verruconis gallopava]KIW02583.1 hypothetical protein PV09_06033 [Verruconis gallopava]
MLRCAARKASSRCSVDALHAALRSTSLGLCWARNCTTFSRTPMATERARLPHEERTAAEPRADAIHDVILDQVEDVNDSIKLFKLKIKDSRNGVEFSAGQWLDVFVPGLSKAGGFTLTSTPRQALPPTPFLELAVQKSPENPPAAWLWQKTSSILGSELKVRVGGSFTWPPFGWSRDRIEGIKKVIFVAGGVGINPLISMLAHMHDTSSALPEIHFLYSTKPPLTEKQNIDPGKILFLSRLTEMAGQHPDRLDLTLFLTCREYKKIKDPQTLGWFHDRRIEETDLRHALGENVSERSGTVVYVCGPPKMTDEIVAWFGKQDGLSDERIFCEKWW